MTGRRKIAPVALKLIVLAIVAVGVLGSCQVAGLLFGVTIDQRIKDFSDGYTGGNYANLYTDFSDNTAQKPDMKAATFWDSTPFAAANSPQAIGTYTITNSTVTGTFSNGNGTFSMTMQMQQSGTDWYILSITLTPQFTTTAGAFTIKRIY